MSSAPWLLALFPALWGPQRSDTLLVMSVRAGRRDVAVLTALGFARSQVHATVRWQASAMVAVGLIPGYRSVSRWAGGSGGWSSGAREHWWEPVMALPLLPAAVVTAFLLANLIAAIPTRWLDSRGLERETAAQAAFGAATKDLRLPTVRKEPLRLAEGAGKSHLLIGLGIAACDQGRRVRYVTCAQLVHELVEAADERRLSLDPPISSSARRVEARPGLGRSGTAVRARRPPVARAPSGR